MGIEIPDYVDQAELEKLYVPNNLTPTDEFTPIQAPKNLEELLNNK